MVSITKSLKHMAWSSQKIFEDISKFPDEIYGLKAADSEWPVGRILTHFLNAGEWYRYILSGDRWSDIKPITNSQLLLESAKYLAQLDEFLISESFKDDGEVKYDDESGPSTTTRSMVLSQAVMHTAEHKGQLGTILITHGFHLDLDKYDVWAFESQ